MSGPGGRLAVSAPRHVPTAFGLLTSAEQVLPNLDGDGDGQSMQGNVDRWLNGVSYQIENFDDDTIVEYLGNATGTTPPVQNKPTSNNPGLSNSDAFVIVADHNCSTVGWTAQNYAQRARDYLALWESYKVERELWAGVAAQAAVAAGITDYSQKYLANASATTLNSGNALSPVRSMSYLLGAQADCAAGAQWMIHVPRRLIPFLISENQIRVEGNKLYDTMGNIIVAGAGYPGTSPAGAAPAANTAWIYGTSLVRYWRGEVMVTPGAFSQAMTRNGSHEHLNSIQFFAERPYLLDWDETCHFAVLVDLVDS